ncbi:MAG: hypothetical protein JW862_05785 [Anaerolineales bacterium]|nr:hypothetical protein [Anaerolineales bacterium]
MMVTPAQAPPIPQVVSVRSLVEFVLPSGDLTPGGFQRRDRAQAGTQAHQRLQRARPESYQSEVEVVYPLPEADPPLEIRGRIDGLDTGTSACCRGVFQR